MPTADGTTPAFECTDTDLDIETPVDVFTAPVHSQAPDTAAAGRPCDTMLAVAKTDRESRVSAVITRIVPIVSGRRSDST